MHQVPVASYLTLGGFSYPLGTQNLSVTESREDEHQILSTHSKQIDFKNAFVQSSLPAMQHHIHSSLHDIDLLIERSLVLACDNTAPGFVC